MNKSVGVLGLNTSIFFSCRIHLSIHRLCHAFIQGRIKIVCLNGYLGSVNTSGQQELK